MDSFRVYSHLWLNPDPGLSVTVKVMHFYLQIQFKVACLEVVANFLSDVVLQDIPGPL